MLVQVFSGATGDFLHGRVGVDLSGAPLWQPAPPPGPQTPEELEASFKGKRMSDLSDEKGAPLLYENAPGGASFRSLVLLGFKLSLASVAAFLAIGGPSAVPFCWCVGAPL